MLASHALPRVLREVGVLVGPLVPGLNHMDRSLAHVAVLGRARVVEVVLVVSARAFANVNVAVIGEEFGAELRSGLGGLAAGVDSVVLGRNRVLRYHILLLSVLHHVEDLVVSVELAVHGHAAELVLHHFTEVVRDAL